MRFSYNTETQHTRVRRESEAFWKNIDNRKIIVVVIVIVVLDN